MRRLNSAYDPDSSLASPILSLFITSPLCLRGAHESGKVPGPGGRCLFYSQAHLLLAACQTLQLLAAGLDDYLPSDPMPAFPFHRRKNSVCLSLSPLYLSTFSLALSCLLSFFDWTLVSFYKDKRKKKKNQNSFEMLLLALVHRVQSMLTPCASGQPLKSLPFLSLPIFLCCFFFLQDFYQVLNTGVCSD